MATRPKHMVLTAEITTPAFVIEEAVLRYNLSVLKRVKDATGCKMFQALKTWSTWELFPIVREYLDGTEVSSLNEARLGFDESGPEVHMFAPAYKDEEFEQVMQYCSTIIFNSFAQWQKFKPRIAEFTERTGKEIECGLRLNPEFTTNYELQSTHSHLWDPCAPGSRLGIRISEFETALAADPNALDGISGFHFHIFWDKEFNDLKQAVTAIEGKFGAYFRGKKWVNFGGGQKITDDGYDVEGLIALVNDFQKKYGVTVHFEPGAAIVKNAGSLVSTVLDVVERSDVPYKIAILDMSFNAHTPDFLLSTDLDMPVAGATVIRDLSTRFNLVDKTLDVEVRPPHIYRLGGGTCVTGDTLSHFHQFAQPLKAGDKVVMLDGIQYNMVQCTMFNGVQHPSIVLWKDPSTGSGQVDQLKMIREFTYQDYRSRMG